MALYQTHWMKPTTKPARVAVKKMRNSPMGVVVHPKKRQNSGI
jgi:hypothetical protein